ncbi:Putative phosphatase [Cronobacter dublinensis 582]|nr:Putative phosphatase [Cronobacter dublinensis 582]
MAEVYLSRRRLLQAGAVAGAAAAFPFLLKPENALAKAVAHARGGG